MAFSKYDQLGAYHWRTTYGAPSLWKFSPQLTANYAIVANLVAKLRPDPQTRCLDLGCGDGVMVGLLSRAGRPTLGVDLEASGVSLARRELASRNLPHWNLLRGDITNLPLPSASFDIVTAIEVIEHIPQVDLFLAEVRRVLRPNGIFLLTTPHSIRRDAVVDPYHVREFRQSELAQLLATRFSGVEVFGAKPWWLDRLYARASRWRPVELAVRLAIKAASRYLLNPFATLRTASPDDQWSLLVGIARNK